LGTSRSVKRCAAGILQSDSGLLSIPETRVNLPAAAGNSTTSIQPSLLSVGLLWTF
jgi:hypothetical protein